MTPLSCGKGVSEDEGDEPPPSTWFPGAPLPWTCLPKAAAGDPFGYGRSPAFWFTLNLAYNHTFDIHRFHKAVALAGGLEPDETCLAAATSAPATGVRISCGTVSPRTRGGASTPTDRRNLSIAAAVAELPSCTPAAKNELFLLAAELARGARIVTARYDAP